MILKKLSCISLAIFLCTLPAFANDKKADAQINITIPPEIAKANEPYKKQFETLSPAQQDALKKLDEDYLQTLQPDFEIIALKESFSACHQAKLLPPGYGKKFAQFLSHQQQKAIKSWESFYHSRIRTINFMDGPTLMGHFKFQRSMNFQLFGGMAKLAGKATEESCKAARDKLDKYIQDNKIANLDPSQNPEAAVLERMQKESAAREAAYRKAVQA